MKIYPTYINNHQETSLENKEKHVVLFPEVFAVKVFKRHLLFA